MVAAMSRGKKAYAQYESQLSAAVAKLTPMREEFKSAIDADVRDRLRALCSEVEDVDARGRHVYWLRRRLEMAVLRTGAKIDKALGAPVTFRNVTTVRKLAAMMSDRGT